MNGLALVAKGKNFTKVISRRPLTLEQRVFDILSDRRAYSGAMWCPWDKSTLFQDAAGTVPVLQDGDPVRLMLDAFGSGHNWVAPSDAARPTYRDGEHPYLQGDGVASEMRLTASGLGIASFANQVSAHMLFLADGVSTYRELFKMLSSSNTERLSLGTGADAAQFRSFVRRKWDDAPITLTLPKPSGVHLWRLFANFLGGSATLTRDLTAAEHTQALPQQKISENPASNGTYLFGFNGTAFANARFYGGAILASERDISAEQADIDAYLSLRAGL